MKIKIIRFLFVLVVSLLLFSTQRETSLAHDLPPGSDWHGHMLLFDGINQLANLGEVQLPDPYNGMTIEALANPICDTEDDMTILASIEGGDFTLYVDYNSALEVYSFAFTLYTGSGIATVNSDTISCDRWYHVAGVYDGHYVSIYVDGELAGRGFEDGFVLPADPPSPMYIGAQYQEGSQDSFFHGWIDEIRLWNYPRSVAQIYYYQYYRVSCDSPFLVGYWGLDDPGVSVPTQIIGNCGREWGFLGFTEAFEDIDPVWVDSDLPHPPSGQWIKLYFPILNGHN